MATSGTYNFRTGTRDQILVSALRKVGALAEGETPSSEMLSNAAYVLETVISEAAVDGMPIWAIDQVEVPLASFASGSATLGTGLDISIPPPLKMLQVVLRYYVGTWGQPDVNTFDRELFILTRQEYNNRSTKFQQGAPINYFYDPRNAQGELYLWPRPNTVDMDKYSLVLVYQRPFQDVGVGTNNLDFPPYWTNAIIYTLAVRLAPEYGVPPNDRQLLNQEAQLAWGRALGFGTEEGSLYIGPDNSRGGRSGYWGM